MSRANVTSDSTKHSQVTTTQLQSEQGFTDGRSDRENERGPIFEIWAKKNVGDISHEQEYRDESGAGCR